MSALAQSFSFNRSSWSLSEFAALREIGLQAASARDLRSGVRALLRTALRVPGIAQITLDLKAGFADLALEWGENPGSAVLGSAVEKIAFHGLTWGEIRVRFHLQTVALESPVRFARFLGQQLGGLLNRFDLLRRRETLVTGNNALRRRIATYKVTQRAKGVIAETRGIAEPEALLLLIKVARQSRRSLAEVAESIVLLQHHPWNASTKPLRPDTTRRTQERSKQIS